MMFLLVVESFMKAGQLSARLIFIVAFLLLSSKQALQAGQPIGVRADELEVLEAFTFGGYHEILDAEVDADQLSLGFDNLRREVAVHKDGQEEASRFGPAQGRGTHFVLIAVEVSLVPRRAFEVNVLERTNDIQSISSDAHEGVGRKSAGRSCVVFALELGKARAILEEGLVGGIQVDGRLLQDLGMGFLYPRKITFELDDLLAHLTKGDRLLVGVVLLDAIGQKIVVYESARSEETSDVGRLLLGGIDAYFYGLEHESMFLSYLNRAKNGFLRNWRKNGSSNHGCCYSANRCYGLKDWFQIPEWVPRSIRSSSSFRLGIQEPTIGCSIQTRGLLAGVQHE